MTKRRMLAMIIALVMCVSLSACSSEKSDSDAQSEFGKFIEVEEGLAKDSDVYQYIMYDPDTMVMYSYLEGDYGGGTTVLYNADGTLKLYSPNAEAE